MSLASNPRSDEPQPQAAVDADSATEPGTSEAYVRWVLFMVLLTMIFNQIDRTILSILVKPIKQEFGLSDTQVGVLLGPAFALVYGALVLPIGRYADTTGIRRNIVATSVFLWSCFTLATSFVTSFPQLFLARMGVGVGEAGGGPPSVSILSDYLTPARRARGLSVVSIGSVIGLGLGMVVGGEVGEAWGWRAAFLVAGLPGIVLAIVFRLTVAEPERGASDGRRAESAGAFWPSLRALLSIHTLLFIFAANGFTIFASMGRNLWEPTFLIRTYGMGPADAGLWYFLTSPLPSMCGIFLGGWLADRLGPRDSRWYLWVPAIGLSVSVPVLFAFLLWPEDHLLQLPATFAGTRFESIPVALLWSVLGSVLGGVFTAPFMATTQSVSPLRMRAFAASVSTVFSTLIGLSGGPLLVGALADGLAADYGSDALRYALLIPTSLPLVGVVICLFGARFVDADLVRARSLD